MHIKEHIGVPEGSLTLGAAVAVWYHPAASKTQHCSHFLPEKTILGAASDICTNQPF